MSTLLRGSESYTRLSLLKDKLRTLALAEVQPLLGNPWQRTAKLPAWGDRAKLVRHLLQQSDLQVAPGDRQSPGDIQDIHRLGSRIGHRFEDTCGPRGIVLGEVERNLSLNIEEKEILGEFTVLEEIDGAQRVELTHGRDACQFQVAIALIALVAQEGREQLLRQSSRLVERQRLGHGLDNFLGAFIPALQS